MLTLRGREAEVTASTSRPCGLHGPYPRKGEQGAWTLESIVHQHQLVMTLGSLTLVLKASTFPHL